MGGPREVAEGRDQPEEAANEEPAERQGRREDSSSGCPGETGCRAGKVSWGPTRTLALATEMALPHPVQLSKAGEQSGGSGP